MIRSALKTSTKPMKRSAITPKVKPLPGILRTAKPASSKPTLAAKPRTRKCAICRVPFIKRSMTHKACSPACALALARQDRERAERKADKVRREKLKSRADYMREAQAAVNKYVRERDADLPCISCGRYHDGQWHAGHYLSRGARPELCFNLDNLNKQCAPCNTHLSGNAVLYRIGLIAKIGLERVEALEGPHEPAGYTIPELISIRAQYIAKLKALVAKKEEI